MKTDTYIEGVRIELVKILKELAEEPDDIDDIDTFETYRASLLITALEGLFLTQREELKKKVEGMKMELRKDESNSDWFYGFGNNQALEQVIKVLEGEEK